MEEKKEESQIFFEEYKGKPVMRIPLVDAPSQSNTWHWFSFGKNKAKAIVKYFEEIKKFAEE